MVAVVVVVVGVAFLAACTVESAAPAESDGGTSPGPPPVENMLDASQHTPRQDGQVSAPDGTVVNPPREDASRPIDVEDASAQEGGAVAIDAGTKVPAFVAVGHMGRTTLSCDDGRSWIANASLDDSVRCFEPLDCDHTSGAGRGLAYGNGVFVASFGWGEPGRLAYSFDGAEWLTGRDATVFAGVAFGNGVFVANANRPLISTDGQNWLEASGELGLDVGNTRAIGFAGYEGGRFVVTGESQARDIVLSTDDGQTWRHGSATGRPGECVGYVRGLAYGNGAIVAASGNGFVCTSTDGAESWVLAPVADRITSSVVYSGGRFMVWSGSVLHESRDGLAWASEQGSPSNIAIGPVAVSPSGTLVSSNDGWLSWYEEQQFYRSTDGVTWEVLAATSFTGSHPIHFIEYGEVEPSAAGCPSR